MSSCYPKDLCWHLFPGGVSQTEAFPHRNNHGRVKGAPQSEDPAIVATVPPLHHWFLFSRVLENTECSGGQKGYRRAKSIGSELSCYRKKEQWKEWQLKKMSNGFDVIPGIRCVWKIIRENKPVLLGRKVASSHNMPSNYLWVIQLPAFKSSIFLTHPST